MGWNAVQNPFSAPIQQFAGFTPMQQQAFQNMQGYQNWAQPYNTQAQTYYNQSAAPISSGEISHYMDPYADYVMKNLGEAQGQQMGDLTGRLTQQAGGVGASRVAVGQSELARQQNLATGQTASGIYGQALGAAQQDRARQANAASGFANLGNSVFGQNMQGISGMYNLGSQQQQLNQQGLNAEYQNTLARLAYPYQQAQYLAGLTGGLAGALGGTTTSNTTTTGPAPSLWSQLIGGATGLAGLAGAMSNPYSSLSAQPNMGGTGYNPYGPSGLYKRGGRVKGYAAGGGLDFGAMAQAQPAASTPPPSATIDPIPEPYTAPATVNPGVAAVAPGLGPMTYSTDPNAPEPITGYGFGQAPTQTGSMSAPGPVLGGMPYGNPAPSSTVPNGTQTQSGPSGTGPLGMQTQGMQSSSSDNSLHFADGGGVDEIPQLGTGMPGVPSGASGNSYIPKMNMNPVPINVPKVEFPKAEQQKQDNPIGDIAKLAMMFLKDGGAVGYAPFMGYADGGSVDDGELFRGQTDDPLRGDFDYDAYYEKNGAPAGSEGAARLSRKYGSPINLDPQATEEWRTTRPQIVRDKNGAPYPVSGEAEYSPKEPLQLTPDRVPTSDVGSVSRPYSSPARSMSGPMSIFQRMVNSDIARPDSRPNTSGLPYPDNDARNDISRRFAKSPWLALMNAGFGMMAGTSPFAGVNIGKGLQQGVQTLQDQRKSLLDEDSANHRARQLMQAAKFHEDQYTRMTKAQELQDRRMQQDFGLRRENLDLQKERLALDKELRSGALEQKGWILGSESPLTGTKIWVKPSTQEWFKIDGDGAITSSDGEGIPKSLVESPAPARAAPPSIQPSQAVPVPQPQQPAPSSPPPQAGPMGMQPQMMSSTPMANQPVMGQPPAPAPQAPPPQQVPPIQPQPGPQQPVAPSVGQQPPLGVPEFAPNLSPPKVPLPTSGYGKGSPLLTAVGQEIAKTDEEMRKKSAALPNLRMELIDMKNAYGVLMNSPGTDSFLTKLATYPGIDFGRRIDAAKAANAAAAMAGKPPPVDPSKLAAVENINKIQARMGMSFASQMNPREAFAGQKIGIESTPGIANSPRGFMRLMAGFEAAAKQTADEMEYWQTHKMKNKLPGNWRRDFEHQNPPDRYLAEAMINNTASTKAKDVLPQAVEELRKNPIKDNIQKFNKIYGDTASFFLKGKMDPYQ